MTGVAIPVFAETKVVAVPSGTLNYTAAENNEVVQFGDDCPPIVYGTTIGVGSGANHTLTPKNSTTLTVLNDFQLKPNADWNRLNVPSGTVILNGGLTQTAEASSLVNSSRLRKDGNGTLVIVGPVSLPGMYLNTGGGDTVLDGSLGNSQAFHSLFMGSNYLTITNNANVTFSNSELGRDAASNHAYVRQYGGTVTMNGTFNLSATSAASADWYVQDGALSVTSGGANVGTAGGTGTLVVTGDGANVNLRGGAVVFGNGSGLSSTAVLQMYGGAVTAAGNDTSFAREAANRALVRMSGGEFTHSGNGNLMIARYGKVAATMTGGRFHVKPTNGNKEFSFGRFSSGSGRLDMSGGEFWYDNSGSGAYKCYIGWEGTGVVSVASSALFVATNDVYLAYGNNAAACGEIQLYEGGTFAANRILMGSGASGTRRIATDGGTFRVVGNGATVDYFVNPTRLTSAYVGRRGVTFDTGNNTATIGNFALDGNSPGAIRKTGSGTLKFAALPQTHGGIEVNEGTVALASGATVGAAYAPTAEGDAGNVYPEDPSDAILESNYLLHRWSFTGGSLVDSIAGAVATITGGGRDGVEA